jgi:hypothetical protein
VSLLYFAAVLLSAGPHQSRPLVGAGCRSERSGSRLSAANPKVALTRGVEAGDWSEEGTRQMKPSRPAWPPGLTSHPVNVPGVSAVAERLTCVGTYIAVPLSALVSGAAHLRRGSTKG